MKEAENFKAGAPKGSCWLEGGESPMKRNGWNLRPESDPWPIARKVTIYNIQQHRTEFCQ